MVPELLNTPCGPIDDIEKCLPEYRSDDLQESLYDGYQDGHDRTNKGFDHGVYVATSYHPVASQNDDEEEDPAEHHHEPLEWICGRVTCSRVVHVLFLYCPTGPSGAGQVGWSWLQPI